MCLGFNVAFIFLISVEYWFSLSLFFFFCFCFCLVLIFLGIVVLSADGVCAPSVAGFAAVLLDLKAQGFGFCPVCFGNHGTPLR